MADAYNGILKAIAAPLLVQHFALDEKTVLKIGSLRTGCVSGPRGQSGRVIVLEFATASAKEVGKEPVPTTISRITGETDDELCEHYYRIDTQIPNDPNEFLAVHSEMSSRGISTLGTLERLRRAKSENEEHHREPVRCAGLATPGVAPQRRRLLLLVPIFPEKLPGVRRESCVVTVQAANVGYSTRHLRRG